MLKIEIKSDDKMIFTTRARDKNEAKIILLDVCRAKDFILEADWNKNIFSVVNGNTKNKYKCQIEEE